MDLHKLVRMANQIGAFFASEPDHEAALDGVASHLSRFWDPRMRRQLLESVARGEASGLEALVLEAVQRHRERLLPRG